MQQEAPISPVRDRKAALEAVRARRQAVRAPEPAPIPQEAPPDKPKEMSVGGFAENLLDDAFELLRGLYQIIPTIGRSSVEIGKAVYQEAAKGRPGLGSVTPKMMGDELWDTVLAVKDSIIEPYMKHGVKVLYERPLTVALDAATVISLGGTSIAKAGRLAGSTRLVQLGEKIAASPGLFARGGLDKAVEVATGGKVNLAKMRDLRTIKREEAGLRIVAIIQDMQNVGQKVALLNEAESKLWHKWRNIGGTAEEWAANPKVAEAYTAYKQMAEKIWQQGLGERVLLSDAKAYHTVIKKYRAEMAETYGKSVKNREAAEAIKNAYVKPVYGPAIFEKGRPVTLDDFLTGPGIRTSGKAGQLEKYTGAKGSIKDPRVYVPRAIAAFRQLESRFRLSERILQSKDLIKAKPGVATREFTAQDVPEGVFRKYYDDKIRGEALKTITDPTVARFLRLEYAKPTGSLASAVRLYDRILNLFRRTAVRWNPKWYTGNAVSDAMFSVLGGGDLMAARRMMAKGAVPSEFRKTPTMATEVQQHGLDFQGWAENALDRLERRIGIERGTELVTELDQATRLGLMTRKVRDELSKTGLAFERSGEAMESVLRSTDQFSEVQVRMQLLEEKIARSNAGVRKLESESARLLAREEKLFAKLEEAEKGRLAKVQEKTAPIEAEGRTFAGDPKTNMYYEEMYGPYAEKATAIRQENLLGGTGLKGFERGMSLLQDLRQKIVNLDTRRSAIIRDIADDMAKKGALEAQVPGLSAQVDIARKGADYANAFIGDYLGLDGFQQGVLRRLVPFYVWAKTMTMLAFRLPSLAPVRTFLWHRYSMAMWSMMGDHELPERLRGYVPIAARENGDLVWLNLRSYSPFAGLRRTEVGKVPIPAVMSVVEQNPFLSLGLRLMGGKTVFDTASVPYGEKMVLIHDGTGVEFTQDGKLRKVLPQTPLVQGVAHMFPITQFAEDLLSPYWTNKYNWAGIPSPILNPDGTTKYPREWWQRLASLGGVTMISKKREEWIRSEKMSSRQAILQWRKMYRRADPDEREMIKEAMRDYMRGDYRKWEEQ